MKGNAFKNFFNLDFEDLRNFIPKWMKTNPKNVRDKDSFIFWLQTEGIINE